MVVFETAEADSVDGCSSRDPLESFGIYGNGGVCVTDDVEFEQRLLVFNGIASGRAK
jgi:hypothetical protein